MIYFHVGKKKGHSFQEKNYLGVVSALLLLCVHLFALAVLNMSHNIVGYFPGKNALFFFFLLMEKHYTKALLKTSM